MEDSPKHSRPFTLAIVFDVFILCPSMEDSLNEHQISALSPPNDPTFPAGGPDLIAMVAPPDERVGNIRRDHLHRPCHAPDRRSGPLAGKATGFIIQRASDDGPRVNGRARISSDPNLKQRFAVDGRLESWRLDGNSAHTGAGSLRHSGTAPSARGLATRRIPTCCGTSLPGSPMAKSANWIGKTWPDSTRRESK
jgi:hypothetical protein